MRFEALCRFLRESVSYFRGLPRGLIVVISEALLLQINPKTVCKGISIVDPFPETRTDFVSAVSEALALVEESDALRFARLKREIGSITNVPVPSGAEYCRTL